MEHLCAAPEHLLELDELVDLRLIQIRVVTFAIKAVRRGPLPLLILLEALDVVLDSE